MECQLDIDDNIKDTNNATVLASELLALQCSSDNTLFDDGMNSATLKCTSQKENGIFHARISTCRRQ